MLVAGLHIRCSSAAPGALEPLTTFTHMLLLTLTRL
jgi:hypothetical protein